MYIDTHCHLNFKAFATDVEAVIKKAKNEGVEKIIVPGTDLKSSQAAVKIAERFRGVYAAVGYHPHHARGIKKIDAEIKKELKRLAQSEQVVAIGECGLDYYVYQKTKYKTGSLKVDEALKRLQKQLFGIQIQLAKELQLPLIIHNREAGEDVLDVIDHFSKTDGLVPKGVVHCISGSQKYLKKVLQLGFYAGVDGNVTYDKKVAKLAKIIPLNKLLIETDSPYLMPEPWKTEMKTRGKKLRNEPIGVKITAQFLAEIKEVTVNQVVMETTKNAQQLFNL